MARLLVDLTPLRRFPQFRRLWLGYLVSLLGSQLTVVAVAYQVFKITHSSADVGLVSIAQLGPALVGALYGGSLADAMDRRRLLMLAQCGMAACSIGLALNGSHGALWPVFLFASVSAGFSGVDSPTRTSIMMTIVGRESFVEANALRQLLQQSSLIAGPAVGGVVLGAFGLSAAYWADVATFAASVTAVATLAPLPHVAAGQRAGVRAIADGFRFLKGRQAIQGCFAADLTATVFGMPTALFPAIGLIRFHGGAEAVGYLYAAPGGGAFVAALLTGWASRVRRLGRAVVAAVVVWGLAITAFGFVGNLPLALVLLGVAGGADLFSALFRNSMIQVEAPDRLRGRLTSINTAVVGGGPRLGNFEAGLVAGGIGVQWSVVSGGLASAVGVVVVALLMPRFSRYHLAEGNAPSDTRVVRGGRGEDRRARLQQAGAEDATEGEASSTEG